MVPVLKFPFAFDAERLKADLRPFGPADWTPHFNTQYYEGDWSGIALRTTKNAHVPLYPDPTVSEFVDTAMLARCSYVPDVLRTFECDLKIVRFLRLGAGAAIRSHQDFDLGFEDGQARVHIPIVTNLQVEFHLDEQLVQMREGEAWYLNFNLFHRVENKGSDARVHLVIDCVVNDWLRSFFPVEDQAQ